uniref:Uncharacterized protein n=1 Tax=Caenorhabditis japonica TaxID=281687 RepID=A0A8R1E161_CAEJA
MRITVFQTGIRRLLATGTTTRRWASSQQAQKKPEKEVFELDGRQYRTDSLYNVSPAVRRLLDRRILHETSNPLNLLKRRITDYVHQTYRKP